MGESVPVDSTGSSGRVHYDEWCYQVSAGFEGRSTISYKVHDMVHPTRQKISPIGMECLIWG